MLEIIKKVWSALKLAVAIIGAAFLVFVGVRFFAGIGTVKEKKNWKKIPGTNKAVMVQTDTGWTRVELPVTEIGGQITTDDINKIGLSKEVQSNEINVEILHTPVDRSGHSGASDMSING
jgi:hypothetical protein